MKPSSVTDLLYNQLSFRGDRQNIISSNIANINTPGYKTKDIAFESELQKVQNKTDLKLATTHASHIPFEQNDLKPSGAKVYEVQGLQEQNDGNNVNLDREMSEMSKNQIAFNALQASVKKDAAWLREVIASSGKN